MSKLLDEFQVDLDGDTAWLACKAAITQIGWGLDIVDETRLIPRIGVGLSRNPSKIEVTRDEGEDGTVVRLQGKITGVGPIQKQHLNAEMNRLRNAIEAEAKNR